MFGVRVSETTAARKIRDTSEPAEQALGTAHLIALERYLPEVLQRSRELTQVCSPEMDHDTPAR